MGRPKLERREIAPKGATLLKVLDGNIDAAASLVSGELLENQLEVSVSFGISANTVRQWRNAGMPGNEGAWPLDAILRWKWARVVENRRAGREAAPAAPHAAPEEMDAERAIDVKRQAEARKVMAEAIAKERKNELIEGSILHRDDVEREIRQVFIVLRDNLTRIHRELMPRFPRELAGELSAEVELRVRHALDQCATHQFSWERAPVADPLLDDAAEAVDDVDEA